MSAQAPFPLTEGASFSHYRLIAPIGRNRNVWRAEDTRQQKPVVVKLLSRAVPADRGRRDALVLQIRKSAALLRHPGIVTFNDVIATDEALVAVLESVAGETLGDRLRRGIPDFPEFLQMAYQLADALDAAHMQEIIHGNLTVDDVLIDIDGNVRLVGFGMNALSGRKDRGDVMAREQTENSLAALAYYSPEQITGKPVDRQSDIYSFGAVLYVAATGKLPFEASTVAEMLTKVTQASPRSPQELNPAVNRAALHIIGKSLFKNRKPRYASLKEAMEDMRKADPEIAEKAAYPVLAKPVQQAPAAAVSAPAIATFLIAELPYHELLRKENPDAATRVSALMQQLVGEAAYLYDGEVLDSVGSRMVAVMPSSAAAIDAARRALTDIRQFNAEQSAGRVAVEPQIVVHRGQVLRRDRSLEGKAADLAMQLVQSLQPLQIVFSETVLQDASMVIEGEPLGTVAGVRFFAFPEPHAEPVAEVAAPAEKPVEAAAETPLAPPRRPGVGLMIAAAAVLVIGVAAVLWLMFQSKRPVAPAPAPVVKVAPPKEPSKLFISSFDIVSTDAALTERTRRIAAGVSSLLRASGAVPMADAPAPGSLQLSVRAATPDPVAQLIPQLSGKGDGPAIDPNDTAAAMTDIVKWVATSLDLPVDRILSGNAAANEHFASALGAASTDPKAALAAVQAAVAADPQFLPAQRLSVDLHDRAGDRAGAVASAVRVASLDAKDTDIRRRLARWKVEGGAPVEAVALLGEVVALAPADRGALEELARYALSAGDQPVFEKLAARIEATAPADTSRIHRPDIFALAGSYDRAAPLYYDIEAKEKSNAALAFKIGRIAALRDSYEIAGLELDKLRRLSPQYGAPLLEAYIAARKELVPETEKALARAQQGAAWNDDFYTYSAEIYGMLSMRAKVIESLEKAISRGEACATFVLLRPPYFYLGYDQRSGRVKSELEAQKFALRAELAKLRL